MKDVHEIKQHMDHAYFALIKGSVKRKQLTPQKIFDTPKGLALKFHQTRSTTNDVKGFHTPHPKRSRPPNPPKHGPRLITPKDQDLRIHQNTGPKIPRQINLFSLPRFAQSRTPICFSIWIGERNQTAVRPKPCLYSHPTQAHRIKYNQKIISFSQERDMGHHGAPWDRCNHNQKIIILHLTHRVFVCAKLIFFWELGTELINQG